MADDGQGCVMADLLQCTRVFLVGVLHDACVLFASANVITVLVDDMLIAFSVQSPTPLFEGWRPAMRHHLHSNLGHTY